MSRSAVATPYIGIEQVYFPISGVLFQDIHVCPHYCQVIKMMFCWQSELGMDFNFVSVAALYIVIVSMAALYIVIVSVAALSLCTCIYIYIQYTYM